MKEKTKTIYHIYGIYNKSNNKIYVGQTKQGYRKRFAQHICPSNTCVALRNAIQKYGKDSFESELLDIAYSRYDANEKEKMWIAALKTFLPENGYNLSMGGVIGDFNAETLRKMSESHLGEKNHFYGKKHSIKARMKMREMKKDRYKNENHPGAKAVRCIETGKIYKCVKYASIDTGTNPKHIGSVANKRYGRKTAGGYHWEWA